MKQLDSSLSDMARVDVSNGLGEVLAAKDARELVIIFYNDRFSSMLTISSYKLI